MGTHKDMKVLLIDDDPGIRKVMTIALEDEGYTVISANDGESGIELCAHESPDVVVTDIRMPGIDGIEVLRRIKEMDPDREVIVATAFSDINYAISALQLDASDFIVKPISEQALMIALKRAQERFSTRRELRDYTALIEERWMETSEELARTFQTRKLLIESSIDGIIASDKAGRIMIFNKSMERMLGYSRTEAIGEMSDRFFCAGEADKFKRALASEELGGKGRLFLYESYLAGIDGSRIPVQLSAAVMAQEEEEVGIVCFVRDEREIRKLAQEVADQARMLHQDKMISLGKLAASVVHEINNPLAGILNYVLLMSKILSRGSLPGDSIAPLFAAAFGDSAINFDRIAKAIATFERTIVSGNSPYDRYLAGDKTALTKQQKAGLDFFNRKGECAECHTGPNLTTEKFANLGIGMDRVNPDPGREVATKKRGGFREIQNIRLARSCPPSAVHARRPVQNARRGFGSLLEGRPP